MGVIMKNKINYTGGGGGGSATLEGLTDVDLSTPTDGQALVYDGANSKWINGNVSGGGGAEAGGMDIYEGAWIATSSSANLTPLTEEITLPAGRYLIVVTSPFTDANVNFDMALLVNGVSQQTLGITSNFSARGQQLVTICTLSDTSTIRAASGTSRSVTWDSAYLSRGFIKAVRLANLQTALIYSEEEREVGVWTDGKPLYQKTFVFQSNLSSAGIFNYAHGIADVEFVADVFGVGTTSGTSSYPINNGRSGNLLGAWANATNISLYIGNNDLYSGNWRITVLYTKTTDTAGSGTWTTTGEYAHHYSTSEKVIGTWIDGKPLYEITREVSNLSSSSSLRYLVDFTDLGSIEIKHSNEIGFSNDGNQLRPGYNDGSNWRFECYYSGLKLRGYFAWGSTTLGVRVTIQYTKTTDV